LSSFISKKPSPPPSVSEEEKGEAEEKVEEVSFPLSPFLIEELSDQARREFNFAFAKAKEWRDDSLFFGMVARYKGGIARENGKNTYIFASPSLADFYWTIVIDQAKNENGEHDYERIIYYREDYFLPDNVAVVPMQYWSLDYLDALQKADELGGKDIRAAYKNYDVNVLLSAREDRYLMWDVEYLVDDESRFFISINAYNGEVS